MVKPRRCIHCQSMTNNYVYLRRPRNLLEDQLAHMNVSPHERINIGNIALDEFSLDHNPIVCADHILSHRVVPLQDDKVYLTESEQRINAICVTPTVSVSSNRLRNTVPEAARICFPEQQAQRTVHPKQHTVICTQPSVHRNVSYKIKTPSSSNYCNIVDTPPVTPAFAGCSSTSRVEDSADFSPIQSPMKRSSTSIQLTDRINKRRFLSKDRSDLIFSPPTNDLEEETYSNVDLSECYYDPSDYIQCGDDPAPSSRPFNGFFIIEASQLQSLVQKCLQCHSDQDLKYRSSLSVEGTCPIVKTNCNTCGITTWRGQSLIPGTRISNMNLRLTAASHSTGMHYKALAETFEAADIAMYSETTHDTNMKYVISAQNNVLDKKSEIWWNLVKEASKDNKMVVSIDTQYDSPGFCANLACISFVCNNTELLIHVECIEKNETGGISQRMEREGVRRGLVKLEEEAKKRGMTIARVITDESASVGALMRDHFPHIEHGLDPWHVRKNFLKKLKVICNKKEHEDLKGLYSVVNNHFWAALAEGGDNGEIIRERFNSILYHVIGIHNWNHDKNYRYVHGCNHSKRVKLHSKYVGISTWKRRRTLKRMRLLEKDGRKITIIPIRRICIPSDRFLVTLQKEDIELAKKNRTSKNSVVGRKNKDTAAVKKGKLTVKNSTVGRKRKDTVAVKKGKLTVKKSTVGRKKKDTVAVKKGKLTVKKSTVGRKKKDTVVLNKGSKPKKSINKSKTKILKNKEAKVILCRKSASYRALVGLILNKKLQESIQRLQGTKTTAGNELFNSNALKYRLKRVYQKLEYYLLRSQTTALHFNSFAVARYQGRRILCGTRLITKKGREGKVEKKIFKGGDSHEWRIEIVEESHRLATAAAKERKEGLLMKKMDQNEKKQKEIMKRLGIRMNSESEDDHLSDIDDEEVLDGGYEQDEEEDEETDQQAKQWLEYISNLQLDEFALEESASEYDD